MTPRNSRGVFLCPDERMGIAETLKARTWVDRSISPLECLAREIAIAGQVIEPGCACPELQQPSGVTRANARHVTGSLAQRPKDMNPAPRRRPRGDVVDQYREAACSYQAPYMQKRSLEIWHVMQRRRAEDQIKAIWIREG